MLLEPPWEDVVVSRWKLRLGPGWSVLVQKLGSGCGCRDCLCFSTGAYKNGTGRGGNTGI